MPLDADAVARALELDPAWLAALRRRWGEAADLAVWGRLASTRIGALPRLRKRVLELGEKLAALDAPRAWIPQPRERLKSALAGALAARTLLAQCAEALADCEAGSERAALERTLGELRAAAEPRLDALAGQWAALLDTQLNERDTE